MVIHNQQNVTGIYEAMESIRWDGIFSILNFLLYGNTGTGYLL
jgi:hypothetical protein